MEPVKGFRGATLNKNHMSTITFQLKFVWVLKFHSTYADFMWLQISDKDINSYPQAVNNMTN